MVFEVRGNTFYVLLNKQEETYMMMVFDELTPSVKKLREYLKNGINTTELELMSVQYKEGQFVIQTIPWNVIAMELVKE